MPHILVVDDDDHIRELVTLFLEREGFDVKQAENGKAALASMEQGPADLVVLDIMMPAMDGWELCERLRELYDVPLLMLTAKGETSQKVKGFRLGADDYLVKPFDPEELAARVKALLKRYKISISRQVAVGTIQLDREAYAVITPEGRMTLPMKEFELLFKLASYPGITFAREQLIEQIWGYDYEGDERTVDVHIKRLRERFPDCKFGFRIATVRGLGYRLEAGE
ncbi:response regulator transcription factor [Cohnella caldifontis]|uniref:response regulator transcription factor n=1 Tax=Cohnella caldifontis TaxID=3027471 RepID=UPI0023EB5A88|nr:response regulator transcription factor [Cohnella sp. YIM B05605]